MSKTDLVEKFGLSFEQEGMPRIAGRLFGFLMLNEGPFTLDELADQLQISKTSASTNTRLLEQQGLLEHVSKAGDRRDYYRVAGEFGNRIFLMAKKKFERFHDLAAEAAAVVPANGASRTRLNNLQLFYEFLIHDIEESFERWQAYQNSGAAGSKSTGKR